MTSLGQVAVPGAAAQYILGLCYAKAGGVELDLAQAAAWYRRAAEQGYDDANKRLNDHCPCGSGKKLKNCHGKG